MGKRKLSRRIVIRTLGLASVGTAVGGVLVACQQAPATPQTVEKVVTQIVEKQVPVTQVVEKQVPVTQVVEKQVTQVVERQVTQIVTQVQTQVVEKQVTQVVLATPAPKAGGTMTIPWWFWEGVQSFSTQRVPRIYMGMLMNIDLDGTLVPNLAEKWEISPDAKTFTFNLRKGVKWHDGQEFDADDVAFTVKYLQGPKSTQANEQKWGAIAGAMEYKADKVGDIEGLKVVDKYTVQMSLSEPFGGWITQAVSASHILPEHVFKNLPIENLQKGKEPAWFDKKTQVGTGPFKFAEGQDEKFIRLERFDDYWGGKPLLDAILFKNVGDDDTQFLGLQKGEIDNMTVVGGIGGSGAVNYYLQAKQVPILEVPYFTRPYHRYLSINHGRPYLQDVRVRQAISHAIDRQLIADTVLGGLGEPWFSFVEHDQWLNKKMPTYQYDVKKAKELLAAAAKDGKWDPNQEIELGFYYPGAAARDFMNGLQKFFTEAGIKSRLAYTESSAIGKKTEEGNFDLTYSGGGAPPEPNAYARWFKPGSGITTVAGKQYLPEVTQKMWDLFQQGKGLADPEKRRPIYDQIQQLFGENVPAIPLLRFKVATALNKKVGGFGPWAQAYLNTWEFSNHQAHKWSKAT